MMATAIRLAGSTWARSSEAEQVAHNHLVVGSNPTGPIEFSHDAAEPHRTSDFAG